MVAMHRNSDLYNDTNNIRVGQVPCGPDTVLFCQEDKPPDLLNCLFIESSFQCILTFLAFFPTRRHQMLDRVSPLPTVL